MYLKLLVNGHKEVQLMSAEKLRDLNGSGHARLNNGLGPANKQQIPECPNEQSTLP